MLYTDRQSGRTAAIARHVSFAQITCRHTRRTATQNFQTVRPVQNLTIKRVSVIVLNNHSLISVPNFLRLPLQFGGLLYCEFQSRN